MLVQVELDTHWGAYSLCNGYPGVCLGSELRAVGREASYGVKEQGGQCLNNDDIGSWFSLPGGGECKDAADVVGVDCSWRVKRRTKTVSMKCGEANPSHVTTFEHTKR
jgi:hypothetical protein